MAAGPLPSSGGNANQQSKHKGPPLMAGPCNKSETWRCRTFPRRDSAVSSGLAGLTAGFEMGPGVPPSLKPPGVYSRVVTRKELNSSEGEPEREGSWGRQRSDGWVLPTRSFLTLSRTQLSPRALVRVGSSPYRPSTPRLSRSSSTTALTLSSRWVISS